MDDDIIRMRQELDERWAARGLNNSDLVSKLRTVREIPGILCDPLIYRLADQAADEIVRMRQQIMEMQEQLSYWEKVASAGS